MRKTKREKLAELFEMPKEVVLDTPKVTIYNNNQLCIENHGGIIEYTDEHISLKTIEKTISINGKNLELRVITDIDVQIEGEISKIEWGN
ncbi:MAG: sporulation protein YqfC [Clostridiaceae bacterium]|jgi:sporulation protein YqfC|nr:sporulation protein YqfC [Clostridiaceae bacterium]